jgi:drug/metabolite transporter (DMT)-like permease
MWLPIAIVAYFINAGVYTADKYFLSKKVHSSVSYAFYVGIWSIGNAVLFWFAPFVPSWEWLLVDASAGLLFLWALVAWYKALHQSEATKVVPIVGAFIPIFSFLLAYIFLNETLTSQQLLALFILIAGGILISAKQHEVHFLRRCANYCRVLFGLLIGKTYSEDHPVRRLIINSLISAFIFAAYYVLIKYIYLHQPFLGSYIWTRMGSFIGALALLLIPSYRHLIFAKKRRAEAVRSLPLFLSIRFLAVIAFILLNYAIALGNVALINALQGVQYVFLIFIILILSEQYPKILREEMSRKILLQKFIGVLMVSVGLYLLI